MAREESEVNIEVQARKMGWLPQEEFRGSKEAWKPADEYVRRGNEFIPFLQADRRRLETELQQTNGKLSVLERTLAETTETLKAFQEFRTELNKERVEERREQLVEGIKAARESGDVAAEEALREKLVDTKLALKEQPKVVAPQQSSSTDVTQTPEWKQFVEMNPWWNDDPVMRAASVAIGQDLATKGELNGLSQSERFDKIAAATKRRFGVGEPPVRRESKVEGSRGGATGGSSSPTGQTYADLPPDVKDGISRFESRLVGTKPGQFKTIAEYRASASAEYFRKYPNG